MAEIPFAGHPTVGCAFHLATASADTGDFDREITLEEEAGMVPVWVWRRGDVTKAECVAKVIQHRVNGADPTNAVQIAAALGLAAEDIGFHGHAPGLWQGGPRFHYAPVASLAALAKARPMEPAWSEVAAQAGTAMMFLYAKGQDCDFRSRMFGPGDGAPEDPATGSASAILAAQILTFGALGEGESRFTLHQGVEMGRPSVIGLTVQVAGGAVPVSEGRIMAPTRG